MRALLLSDLHLDHWDKNKNSKLIGIWGKIQETVDCIFCAGDLCQVTHLEQIEELLNTIKVPMYYVMGNHDAFGVSYANAINIYRALSLKYPLFHFLHNEAVQLNEYTILGTPLFTDYNLYGNGCLEIARQASFDIGDYTKIRKSDLEIDGCITPYDYVQLHLEAKNFIKESLNKDTNAKYILLTHWLPTAACIPSEYIGDSCNPYFATNCDDILYNYENIPYWFFGHTHKPRKLKVNKTTLICNPRGYKGEKGDWMHTNLIVQL